MISVVIPDSPARPDCQDSVILSHDVVEKCVAVSLLAACDALVVWVHVLGEGDRQELLDEKAKSVSQLVSKRRRAHVAMLAKAAKLLWSSADITSSSNASANMHFLGLSKH